MVIIIIIIKGGMERAWRTKRATSEGGGKRQRVGTCHWAQEKEERLKACMKRVRRQKRPRSKGAREGKKEPWKEEERGSMV
jgi:hypothetical protein